VSRRFELVEITPSGDATTAGYAPYLDYRHPQEDESSVLAPLLQESWLHGDLDELALDHAIEVAVPNHLAEVRARTIARVTKARAAVRDRLTKAIAYWDHRAAELREQADAGKQPRMNPDRARSRADELQTRLKSRTEELDRDLQLAALPPVVVGGALIVPASVLHRLQSAAPVAPLSPFALDRDTVERRAVEAVLAAEARLGRSATEMHRMNPGYDIQSEVPEGDLVFIEVKGRIAGADQFVVTRNEILHALNVPESWILALVEVSLDGPRQDRVRYLREPFGDTVHLPFATTAATLNWHDYWNRGSEPS
jgi:hypothetical protein